MARPPPTPRQWRVVFIVGAGNSAGQAAVHLARSAASVTLLVRGERLAASMSDYLLRELEDARNIRIRLRTAVVNGSGSARLTRLTLRDNTRGTREEVPADALYVMIGAKPHTDWLAGTLARDEQGYIVTGGDVPLQGAHGWPLDRPPMLLETSLPGLCRWRCPPWFRQARRLGGRQWEHRRAACAPPPRRTLMTQQALGPRGR